MKRLAAIRASVGELGGWRSILAMRPSSAVHVLEYHLLGYRRSWRGSLFTTFLSPVLFLTAIGVGLGSLIDEGGVGVAAGITYLAFLAPGLLAANAMQTAQGESTYPIMAGLTWQKTFGAMVTTPLRPFDVVLGTLLFISFRLVLVATVFVAVAIMFGAMDLVGGIATIPVALLTGLAFAGPIMAFSATQRDDGNFAALFRFVITPLFLFSGTFFPISQLPAIIQPIAFLTPLWHGVNLARTVALGIGDLPLALLNLVVLVAFAVVGALLTGLMFGRRLVA
jgi:lipooligosaccharide transport system permease protein